jgi:hypothetical protein
VAKKRKKALPTQVYAYGCDFHGPRQADSVMQQLRMANQYRNEIVATELARREAYHALLRDLSPKLLDLQAAIAAINVQTDEIGSLSQPTAEQKAEKKALAAKRTALRLEEKMLQASLREMPEFKQRNAENDEMIDARTKAAYKAFGKQGLFWGTRTDVLSSAMQLRKGPPPRFKRFNGTGCLSVQVQTQVSKGEGFLTVPKLLAGDSELIKLRPVADEDRQPWMGNREWWHLQFLLGAEDESKRITSKNPRRYADILVRMHRPLPDYAHVTWIKLQREVVGTRSRWKVLFTLASNEGFPKLVAQCGVVGIDIGYRPVGDIKTGFAKRRKGKAAKAITGRDLRIAVAAGTDGAVEEFVLPFTVVEKLSHRKELQSLRDTQFDIMRDSLCEWLKSVECPEWLAEDTKTISRWRSPRRLAKLYFLWKHQQWNLSSSMFSMLEAWQKKDRHLLQWQSHEADRVRRFRKDIYSNWAKKLSQKYRYCVLEDIDLSEHAVSEDLKKQAQRNRMAAAISLLRSALKASGMQVLAVDARNTSRRCNACGTLNEVKGLTTWTCKSCAATWDRDVVAARNVRDAGVRQLAIDAKAPMTQETPGPLDPCGVTTYDDSVASLECLKTREDAPLEIESVNASAV